MVSHCFSLLSIACLDWRNRVGSKRLRGFTRDEGFSVSWTGCGGMFGGLVRWPVNTDDCMTRPMMQGGVNAYGEDCINSRYHHHNCWK